MSLTDAVSRHTDLFNESVRSGDFTPFLATFADDAVMTFDGLPIGPFRGLAAISAAYAAQPPTDTLSVRAVEQVDPDTARVAVDYDNGGSGFFALRWRDGHVVDLRIAFD